MQSGYQRFVSNARISWISSTAFATVGTAVVTLVALPVLEVVMVVLLGADLATPDLVRTGYAAALVAIVAAVTSGVVAAVATDRNLGIFEYAHVYRRFDPAYWLAKAVMPGLLSLLTAALVLGTVLVGEVLATGWGPDTAPQLLRTLSLVPLALLLGLLLGIAAAGIGVSLPDPYLGATILGTLLPLAAGVIVPVALYPAWLQPLSYLLPGSGMVDALASSAGGIWRDLLLAGLWAGLGLACTLRALAQLRAGVRRESL